MLLASGSRGDGALLSARGGAAGVRSQVLVRSGKGALLSLGGRGKAARLLGSNGAGVLRGWEGVEGMTP